VHAGEAGQGDHVVAVPAQEQGLDVLDRAADLPRDEGAEAGDIERAGLAHDAVGREAGRLPRGVDHRVERVGDDDHDRVGRVLLDLLAHALDDLDVGLDQVVAAHAGLAGQARGDDDDVEPAMSA
jgi:hypothetical protein